MARTSGHSAAAPDTPGVLRLIVGVGVAQTLGMIVFVIAVAIAAMNSGGWRSDTTIDIVGPAEVITYSLFAAGIGWATWGMRRVRINARTPFLVAQLFAIVIGDTVRTGSDWAPPIGIALIATAVVTIVLLFTPPMQTLFRREV